MTQSQLAAGGVGVLMRNRVQTMLRRSRGKDANAACGQLRLRHISQ